MPDRLTRSSAHYAQRLQHGLVADAFLHRLHQLVMRNRRKTVSDVRFHHPPAAPPALINEHLQGIMRRPPRAEPETGRQEIRLEDRLEHDLHRGLHDPVPDRGNRKRPLLPRWRARLGYEYPPGRLRTVPAFPQPSGQLIEQPDNPVLLDGGQGDLVDARRAIVRAHRDPRAPQNVTAADLVIQRVEPSPGIGLGRPVQRMLQGTDRIRRHRPLRGGTSRHGTHRAPPDNTAHRRSSGPSHHRRLCCPPGSTGTTAASDALPAPRPLPGSSPVIGQRCFTGTGARFSRGGPPQFPPPPSERSAPLTPDSPSRLHFQDLHRFHGLRRDYTGSALPHSLTTLQASLDATDRSVAPLL